MFILIFFILLIQFFSYWVFEPLTTFLTNLLEIKIFPIFILGAFIFLFNPKNNKEFEK